MNVILALGKVQQPVAIHRACEHSRQTKVTIGCRVHASAHSATGEEGDHPSGRKPLADTVERLLDVEA
eukprot:scaffold547_cov384-Prasinococcus_capsulatus_cf.AAC.15